MSNRLIVAGVLAAGTLALAGGIWWRREAQPAASTAKATTSPDTALMLAERSRGDSFAPVTIYEFSDFQCPYCRKFWEETMPALEREYLSTGKARLVFLNYPIPELHPNAAAAHRTAMCAARQDRFWPMHDLLFRHQASWEGRPDPASYFRALGDSVGLDRETLRACVESKSIEVLVEADSRIARESGIGGTPAFVINGGLMPGAQPIEIWRPILDSIFKATAGQGESGKGEERNKGRGKSEG